MRAVNNQASATEGTYEGRPWLGKPLVILHASLGIGFRRRQTAPVFFGLRWDEIICSRRWTMQEFCGIQIAQSWEENATPQNTALIVYDMQVGITPQIANGQEI